MKYISFTMFSAWFIFLIYYGFKWRREFWAKAWKLQKIKKGKGKYLQTKNIFAPKWVTNKELRQFCFWSGLKELSIVFLGFPLLIGFLASIEMFFFQG